MLSLRRRTALVHICCAFVLILAGGGCTVSGISIVPENIPVPQEWNQGGDAGVVNVAWVASFASPTLESFVAEAIADNRVLKQERMRLLGAEQAVTVVRSSRLPVFNIGLDASKREVEDSDSNSDQTESYSASVDGRFDVDLWGSLSKTQQAAELDFAAQAARVKSTEHSVARVVAGQYFDVVEAAKLLEVANRRFDNTLESHEIVASGYRQGLNDALDLYLARNQVERERANLAQQEQNLREAMAALQLSVARYPDGNVDFVDELPVISDPIAVGLPSELLFRRPDLQEAWLNLLAADAELAAAHKSRFPRLTLIGNAGNSSTALSNLVGDGLSSWSLALRLTQPLFDAGRLAALEKQALVRVQIAEEVWLDLVYRAFAEVENSISQLSSLETRYNAFLEAQENSRAALDLALNQYQRGLVSYTTVLESQRQAFDAESTVVQLKNQRLQNRLALYLALGGEFRESTLP